MSEILRLMHFFPNSFINCHFELILSPKGNVYFKCNEGMTRKDVLCKIFEWCSRYCAKGEPYVSERTNKIWRDNLISNFNEYLETNFNQDDFYLIYDRLGNAVNHDLTVKFVESGFNMDVLLKEEST